MNQKKRPTAKPVTICSLAPTNQKEQEEAFFANGCSTNTLKARYYRAMSKLRTLLAPLREEVS